MVEGGSAGRIKHAADVELKFALVCLNRHAHRLVGSGLRTPKRA